MSELTTDQIYKKITERALEKAEKELQSHCHNFIKNIGLAGTSENITARAEISPGERWKEVRTTTDVLMADIVKSLIEIRRERIKKQAVSEFINSVDTFKQQMAYLEQYQLEY